MIRCPRTKAKLSPGSSSSTPRVRRQLQRLKNTLELPSFPVCTTLSPPLLLGCVQARSLTTSSTIHQEAFKSMCPITIEIGSEQRDLPEADPSWINTQINRRRSDRQTVCVRVTVHTGDVHVSLSTPTCPRGVGGRPPNRSESQVINLWNTLRLNRPDFTGGQVVAFLARVCPLVGVNPPSFLHQAA